MSHCGASLVLKDVDGIDKNWPCQKSYGHDGLHATFLGRAFTDAEDWRTVERHMFDTKTGIHSRKVS